MTRAGSIDDVRTLLDLMRRQLDASRQVKRALLAAFVTGYVGMVLAGELLGAAAAVLMMGAAGGWLAGAVASARTSRMAQQVAQLAAAGAPTGQIEKELAQALGRFTLYRTVRVVLYHHLAILRHRQGRFDEASAIAAALLMQSDLGLAGRLRRTLLLVLAEARLQRHDPAGAFGPIATLHRMTPSLSIAERVHLMAIQLRYETMCGHDAAALAGVERKLPLIDLLPPVPAAVCHDVLAAAARRTGRDSLADWLTERADLLAPDRRDAPPVTFDPMPAPPLG